jgi:hypothetical protein
MRIIKLSSEEFETVGKVISYFEEDLPMRTPSGQFRIPRGWIAEDGLTVGEPLFFSYQGEVLYSAKAGTGRQNNRDEYSDEYPFYFLVDMKTVRRIAISLEELEERLRATGRTKAIVKSQGWPTLPDSPSRDELWSSLRGE